MSKKLKILESAMREFSTKGFNGASTFRIAQVANTTQPLTYHHFTNKFTLWKEAVNKSYIGNSKEFNRMVLFELLFGESERLSWLSETYSDSVKKLKESVKFIQF